MMQFVTDEVMTTAPRARRSRAIIASGAIIVGALGVPAAALTAQAVLFDGPKRVDQKEPNLVTTNLASLDPVVAPLLKSGVDNSFLNPLIANRNVRSATAEVNPDGSPADGESVTEAARVKVEMSPQVADIGEHDRFQHPVANIHLTSVFGWRQNPTGAGVQLHIGQDYGVACGTPVTAAADGEIIQSAWAGHSGNRITIQHKDDFRTAYSHNTTLLVDVGDQIKRGDVIALAGTTGNSTGCHVHFEVQQHGKWVNPALFLPVVPGQPVSLETPEGVAMGAAYNHLGGYGRNPGIITNPADDVLTASNSVKKPAESRTSTSSAKKPVSRPAPSTSARPQEETREPEQLQSPKPPANEPDVPTDSMAPAPDTTSAPERRPEPQPKPDPSPEPQPSPVPTPDPTPAPAPSPDPTPMPTPEPSPDPTTAPEPSPDPTTAPEPTPSPEPTPDPTKSPSPEPSPDPTEESAPPPALSPADVLEPAVFAQQCAALQAVPAEDQVALHKEFSNEFQLDFSLQTFLQACGLSS